MSDFEEKFATFVHLMEGCSYKLPDDLYDCMKRSMVSAGFDEVPLAAAAPVTKTKKLSGYNLFMREKMADLKEQNVASNERMGKVSGMWKELGDEGKQEWKDKAASVTPPTVTMAAGTKTNKAKKTGPKKLSGYQFFVKEKMPEMKEDTSIESKERMGKIGAAWKALNEDEQQSFKDKATAANAQAAAEWEDSHGSDE